MEEVKFRYWDTFNGVMLGSGYVSLAEFFGSYEKCLNGENNPVLMQYTGLKDRNGTDIFEGDIIQEDVPDGGVFIVVFKDGSFGTQSKEWEFEAFCNTTTGNDVIIGNIYENPELLK